MAPERIRTSQDAEPSARPTTAELFDRLSRFDGPPERFLANLLALQCLMASAEGGAILRPRPDEQVEILAAYPPLEPESVAPAWLAEAVESAGKVLSDGQTVIRGLHEPHDLYGAPAGRHLVLIPLKGGGGVLGLAAFLIQTADAGVIAATKERLELTASLLSLYEMRLAVQRTRFDLARLRTAMETLSAVNEPARFAGSGMALCNEISSRWQAERVGLGFLKGRYVHLKALSHTEKFSRKMKLIQDLEAAMEECLDQDLEVLHPPGAEAPYVSRAAGELSARHGPTVVCCLPLRRAGQVVGVVSVERACDQPLPPEQVEALRLTCDLCTPRLHNLYEQDRWFGAKLAAGTRQTLALAVGAKHTWIKLVAILVFAAAAYGTFARGAYQAEAPFSLEAVERQVLPAPFDGQLKAVNVDPGDAVEGGKTVLAELKDNELRLQLGKFRAEQAKALAQVALAERDNKPGETEVAQADADGYAADIALLEYQLEQAKIVSPLSGVVVAGDLKRHVNAPVKKGDVLFEVARLASLRAELAVPEDQVADVVSSFETARKSGTELRGELATAAFPEKRVGFVVERINPVAEVANQQNVFKVRVRLENTYDWMRPGMAGVAKIDIDRRSYAWLWTRRLANWLRMKLWV